MSQSANQNEPASIVRRAGECETITAPWGALTWFANARQGNCREMTVGRCVIKPGCANPLHSHPNCTEVLVVLAGRIAHRIEGGAEIEMGPGDVITLPTGLPHNARNLGDSDAVLLVTFSSADRQTRGE